MKSILTLLSLTLLSGPVLANECELTIDGDDRMQFSTKAMSAPASCKEVTVTLKHTGKLPKNTMGHNWVLSETSEYQSVAQAGQNAGISNNYVPPSDERVIAYTDVIGGGESASVTFSTEGLKGKDLTFFCSFPGHWAIMKGTFTLN